MVNHPNRKASKNSAELPVVVTTAHRGVFFGYAQENEARDANAKNITLRGARNCVYWPSNNKGFVGLAATGPVGGARVGPAADMTLRDVTCVLFCSPEAVKAWEAAPWR